MILFKNVKESIGKLTLPMLKLVCPRYKDAKIFENHLNPIKLMFII